MSVQPLWLERASLHSERDCLRKAVKYLARGEWEEDWQRLEFYGQALALAEDLACRADGRTRRRAEEVREALASRALLLERRRDAAKRDATAFRAGRNLKVYARLVVASETSTLSGDAYRSLTEILRRIDPWRDALYPAFLSGYGPVERLGSVRTSETESVRLKNLVTEVAGEIALAYSEAVDDLRELRTCVSACLGYAASLDDIRVRELISSIQRITGNSIEMPVEAAVSTVVLDAMEAAALPRDDRGLFKCIARWALYVGLGAGIHDVVAAGHGSQVPAGP